MKLKKKKIRLPLGSDDLKRLKSAFCEKNLCIHSGIDPDEFVGDLSSPSELVYIVAEGSSMAEIMAGLPDETEVAPDTIIISVIMSDKAEVQVNEFNHLIGYVNRFDRSVNAKWVFSNSSEHLEADLTLNILYITNSKEESHDN